MSPNEAPLVRVEHVSKKFCRSLRRSLWYGLRDLGDELAGGSGANRLHLRKDEFLAIDDVSFELRRGECLGLIGANGAGKSTLLKMLNGLVRPDAGRIEIRGRVGALIELGAGFNPILTGRENVYVNGAVLGLTRDEIDESFDEIVLFAGLHEFIDSPIQSYSSGMRVRLGFSIAAHLEPDVLLLDEVLAVGDEAFRAKCIARVAEIRRHAAVIFVSHQIPLVSRLCSKVLVLRRGQQLCLSSDLQEGFAAYLDDFDGPVRQSLNLGVLAVSNFVIAAAHALSDARDVRIRSGAEVRMSFDIAAQGTTSHDCFVSVTVSDEAGRAVGQCDSRGDGYVITAAVSPQRVRIVLPDFQLKGGHYSVSLHFVEVLADGRAGRLLHSEQDIGRVLVEGTFHGFGPMSFRGRFETLGTVRS